VTETISVFLLFSSMCESGKQYQWLSERSYVMKRFFVFALALCLFAPMTMAQSEDAAPTTTTVVPSTNPSLMALGDVNWSFEIQTATGDNRQLGCEFDGTDYFITGSGSTTGGPGGTSDPNNYVYRVSAAGVVITTHLQANTTTWGFRDLAYDMSTGMLYTGDPGTLAHVLEYDPVVGSETTNFWGPYNDFPRGIGWDPNGTDFWCGDFSGPIYNFTKANVPPGGTAYTNPGGLAIYGMGIRGSNCWIWSQAGTGGTAVGIATEWNIVTHSTTGNTFTSTPGIGIAGGSCVYDTGGGVWEMAAMHQGTPDALYGYDINLASDLLEIGNDTIPAWLGGTAGFLLHGGPPNALKQYGLFGVVLGTNPGTPLPTPWGGPAPILPLNLTLGAIQDPLFPILLNILGFGLGAFDASGEAVETLVLPEFVISSDFDMYFAYAIKAVYPDGWIPSNAVVLHILAFVPQPYIYDDGETNNMTSWTLGGVMAWVHAFDAGYGDTISRVGSAFGAAAFPGLAPTNGWPVDLHVWEDPDEDRNPDDYVLLDTVNTTVVNVDTDIINFYDVGGVAIPIVVDGIFFVGAAEEHTATPREYVAPVDQHAVPQNSEAWLVGAIPASDWNPNTTPPPTIIADDAFYLLRAQ
jgi:hypothetical protein